MIDVVVLVRLPDAINIGEIPPNILFPVLGQNKPSAPVRSSWFTADKINKNLLVTSRKTPPGLMGDGRRV